MRSVRTIPMLLLARRASCRWMSSGTSQIRFFLPSAGSASRSRVPLQRRWPQGMVELLLPPFGLCSYLFRGCAWRSAYLVHSHLSASHSPAGLGWTPPNSRSSSQVMTTGTICVTTLQLASSTMRNGSKAPSHGPCRAPSVKRQATSRVRSTGKQAASAASAARAEPSTGGTRMPRHALLGSRTCSHFAFGKTSGNTTKAGLCATTRHVTRGHSSVPWSAVLVCGPAVRYGAKIRECWAKDG